MKRSVTLKENYEFRRVYAKGKSIAVGCVVLYCRRNRGANRLGLTVSTKLGGAVVRNRVRRRLREIYRLHGTLFRQGYDLVVVARKRAAVASYRELERSFLNAAEKLSLLEDV